MFDVKDNSNQINLPSAISWSVTYVDTVELFFRSIPVGLRKSVEKIIGKRVLIKPCKDGRGKIWGYRLAVNQPTLEILSFFAEFQTNHWCRVSRLDLAVDFITDTQDRADALALYLWQHLVLRYRRKGLLKTMKSTGYWSLKSCSKNLVLYADKPARTVEGHPPCAHLQLRILRAGAVERAGLDSIDALITLNIAENINRHLYLMPSFDADRFASTIIRRSLAAERKSFLGRVKKRSSQFTDQYRSKLRHRFACYIDRCGLNTAQSYKDAHPRAAQKMKRAAVITINSTPHSTNSPMIPNNPSVKLTSSYDQNAFLNTPKSLIKRIILTDPSIPVAEIQTELERREIKVSRIMISAVRTSFREDLKVLQEAGLLITP